MLKSPNGGFSLIETLVLVLSIIVGLSLFAVAAERNEGMDQHLKNGSNLRHIHQAMVLFAQDNNSTYPGYTPQGEPIDLSTEHRFQILLESGLLEVERVLSPVESLDLWQEGEELTHENYSYAMLYLDGPRRATPRNQEWMETLNSRAAVLSDRNTGPDADDEAGGDTITYTSIWTTPENPGWRGHVAWNDNHVSFEVSPEVGETIYGRGEGQQNDHLFESDRDDDALMTFSRDADGAERIVPQRAPEPREGE